MFMKLNNHLTLFRMECFGLTYVWGYAPPPPPSPPTPHIAGLNIYEAENLHIIRSTYTEHFN